MHSYFISSAHMDSQKAVEIVSDPNDYCQLRQISLLSTNAIKREPGDEQSTPQVTTQFKEIVIDHFGKDGNTTGNEEYRMPHPVW